MADSQFRLIGRGLGVLAAATLLAGVSLDAAAYGSKGTIFFETGKSLTNFQFVYASPSGVEDRTSTQTFSAGKGCTTTLDPVSRGLVILKPMRGTSLGTLGYIPSSLGVFDGPQGTACGRISEPKAESIELELAGGLPNNANAFDRLELDLEVKGDVVLRLDVKFDSRVVSYYLESGAGVAPAGATNVFNCRLTSDSGPDAGASDNCTFIVNELGKSFSITPLRGEFSLEGGADWGDLNKRTKIFLTEADGIYDCGQTVNASDTAISCAVTRLDPGGAVACTPVPYVFRASGGSCELTVDPQGQQLVANLLVSYKPELATGVTAGAPAGALDYTKWPAADLSQVTFAGDSQVFDIPACRGFTIDDGNGPSPIPEAKPDWIGGNSTIEFACAFQRLEIFETNSSTGFLETWISEGIQFWGDIKFERL